MLALSNTMVAPAGNCERNVVNVDALTVPLENACLMAPDGEMHISSDRRRPRGPG
jgi:hypothetical protein